MGVQGLWELLAPVGRRVSVETLAGKKLAIDASIWMVQFMKAMRDEKGEMVRNAHLLGFFRRICKLLFLRTKPVFVFDGGTPALKRRTIAARRRSRENARAKIRKTAEKLLLNQLKARKLEELAAEIKRTKESNDAKGKQVLVEGEVNLAGTSSGGTDMKGISAPNQETLDELLAASLAAEEEGNLMGNTPSSAGPAEEDEEDNEDVIYPIVNGNVDPAVLASLPPSMQLDLLVQMRERLIAENRQKYQKIKKAPSKFSELQIKSYLKTVAFRREIDEVQKTASGKGRLGGVQTSRIASEANREFIFSSSFTGDKQILASARTENNNNQKLHSLERGMVDESVSRKTSIGQFKFISPDDTKEPIQDFGDVETYFDERGRVRVSRVRGFGMRMTRDLQRNLDLMKEHENHIRNKGPQSVTGITSGGKEKITNILREHGSQIDNISLIAGDKAIEISFCDDDCVEDEADNDLFSRLAGGTSVIKFSLEAPSVADKPNDESEDIWEEEMHEDVVNTHNLHTGNQLSEQATSDDGEVDWEEGVSAPSIDNFFETGNSVNVSRGVLEEQDAIEEAIRRSLEDLKEPSPRRSIHHNVTIEKSDNSAPSADYPVETFSYKLMRTEFEEESNTAEDGTSQYMKTAKSISPSTDVSNDRISLLTKTTIGNSNIPSFSYSGSETKSIARSELEVFAQENSALQPTSLDTPLHGGSQIHFGNLTDQGDDACILGADIHEDESRVFCSSSPGDGSALLLKGSPPEDVAAIGKEDGVQFNKVPPQLHSLEENPDSTVSKPSEVEILVEKSETKINNSETLEDMMDALSTINKTNTPDKQSSTTIHDTDNFRDESNDLRTTMGGHEPLLLHLEQADTSVNSEISRLRQEREDLSNEQRKHETNAESVSSEMFAECQELLQMFGLPYIIAPMEAEAQCAYMEMQNLIDGVVTDDSDVFLFGARSVYKNIFDDRKYVETYFMKDMENELGLTREKLINMALLLGSDYTEGVSGIGIVNAIEVVQAFPEENGLKKFREWVESPDPSILGKLGSRPGSQKKRSKEYHDQEADLSENAEALLSKTTNHMSSFSDVEKAFMEKHRNVSKNWHLPASFPSESVISAYTAPQVDKSTELFSWGKPDLVLLRKLCWERFGWNNKKADELLVPVLKEFSKHETQLRLEAFYSFNERFAKIRSQRIKKAVKGITGRVSKGLLGEQESADPQELGDVQESGWNDFENMQMEEDQNGLYSGKHSELSTEETSGRRGKGATKRAAGQMGRGRGRGRRGRGRGRRGRGRGDQSDESAETCYDDHDCNAPEEEPGTAENMEKPRRSGRKAKRPNYTEEEGTEVEGVVVMEDTHGREILGESLTAERVTDSVHPYDNLQTDAGNDNNINDLNPPHVDSKKETEYLMSGGGFCVEEAELDDPFPSDAVPEREEPCSSSVNDRCSENQQIAEERQSNYGDSVAETCFKEPEETSATGNDLYVRVEDAPRLSAMPSLRRKRRKF